MLITKREFAVYILVVVLLVPFVAYGGGEIPIIDAHSQFDQEIPFEEIIELMDQAGVSRTILSARDQIKPKQVLSFASRYPDRITPAVRSKSKQYKMGSTREFTRFLDGQLKSPGFKAMAEVLIWHAEKYHHKKTEPIAPQVVLAPDNPKVTAVLERAVERKWPFVAHIEFAAIEAERDRAERDRFMSGFEAMLKKYPDHPFVLNHVGQLGVEDVRRLISSNKNIHFITAMCNPISNKNSTQPLVNLFKGKRLAPEWKKLITTHPDRFVLGFDNVWARHWRKIYVPQVRLWRKALTELPEDAAHMVAHGNAERLWGIEVSGGVRDKR